jgi:hypothetical protein
MAVSAPALAGNLIKVVKDGGAVDQHLTVCELQSRYPRDRIEFGEFAPCPHRTASAAHDGSRSHKAQRHRDAPHKGRGMAAVKVTDGDEA